MNSPNTFIDHTLLKSTATLNDISKLCREAVEYQFHSVCVNSAFVNFAFEALAESDIKVCSVIGFPLGATSLKAKTEEASRAFIDGAEELDLVINLGLYKSDEKESVITEIRQIKAVSGIDVLKVIIETCYLTAEEIKDLCQICVEAGADFVKTSTGFGPQGATIEQVKLMKQVVGNSAKIKASGGIKTLVQLQEFVAVGADRIGTSSGVAIMNEYDKSSHNI